VRIAVVLVRRSRAVSGLQASALGLIAINAAMFLVEIGAGALAGSQALQADALDFLGNALTESASQSSAPPCGFARGLRLLKV
jgi:hypothetical protein